MGYNIIFFLIVAYQRIVSPYLGNCCRFYPSCSQYALEAISYYGFTKGMFKIVYRLLRCHPWNKGGYDPIKTCRDVEII